MPKTKTAETKITVKKTKTGLSMPLYDIEGKELKSIGLSKDIFNIKASPKLLSQYVRIYLANQRSGTAMAKTRGEVGGSTRKIYRQKGTGRARHGSMKAPIFVGGGVVGGPRPRDFSLKFNKKQIKKVLSYALTLKLKDIVGLSDDSLKTTLKTKNIFNFLKNLKFDGKHILLVLPKMENSKLFLASRNIPRMQITDILSFNAYDTVRNDKIIFLNSALTVLEKRYTQKNEN